MTYLYPCSSFIVDFNFVVVILLHFYLVHIRIIFEIFLFPVFYGTFVFIGDSWNRKQYNNIVSKERESRKKTNELFWTKTNKNTQLPHSAHNCRFGERAGECERDKACKTSCNHLQQKKNGCVPINRHPKPHTGEKYTNIYNLI